MSSNPVNLMSLIICRAAHRSFMSNARSASLPSLKAYWLTGAAMERRRIAELKATI